MDFAVKNNSFLEKIFFLIGLVISVFIFTGIMSLIVSYVNNFYYFSVFVYVLLVVILILFVGTLLKWWL